VIVGGARVGRDGTLHLAFERTGAATAVVRCRYTLPLQVLAPLALDDPSAVVSVLNPTGGLVGGDRLDIDVEVGAAAHACLTTPSATKVYRAGGPPAVQAVRIAAGPGATVEWVPDHTIPFAGAAFRQTIDVTLGEGARLIAVDAFSAGRVARGETWRFALLDSALAIRDARGWLLRDRFVLDGGLAAGGVACAEGHPYWATVVVIADSGVEDFLAALDAPFGAEMGGAVLPRRGALVRCLATDAPALIGAVESVWAAARRHVLGLAPLPLRKQ
jgi:urease accessory protein